MMLTKKRTKSTARKWESFYLLGLLMFFAGAFLWMPAFGQEHAAPAAAHGAAFVWFSPFSYDTWELASLLVVLAIAVAGLLYALMLVKQVNEADKGTERMQAIAAAVREGANAYLYAQFRKIGPLIVVITVLLFFTSNAVLELRLGRSVAFLLGSLFSLCVGFVGMRLATVGNLKVAAAAKRSYGEAMQLGYRTGTITGMLTDGLGLLGGTLIFLAYGQHAYEALWRAG